MNRREWVKQALVASATVAGADGQEQASSGATFGNSLIQLHAKGAAAEFWSLRAGAKTFSFGAPSFPLNGNKVVVALTSVKRMGSSERLSNGVMEHRLSGEMASDPRWSLELVFRIAPDSPVVRFRYVLHASAGTTLTGDGAEVCYFTTSFAGLPQARQVQLSAFNDMFHSYTAAELDLPERLFDNRCSVMGPILVGADEEDRTLLLAYEHGSQEPDSFLEFRLGQNRQVTLHGSKANYVPGQNADGYSTVWMHAAATGGGVEPLATQYRRFVLEYLSLHKESRQPYIFYNTWNFQERNKWSNGKKYLDSMNNSRILEEIDVAHRIGIDVYVMDTGWYEKTGDWQVSRERFPDGLAQVKSRLAQYRMKLGLWFNPTAAAVSSNMLARYRQCVRTWKGREGKPEPIWETEASYPMCLVSAYSDGFADALIRVAKETGARYFKWDAIGQYGCDSPHHWHGNSSNTPEQRSNSYAFQLPLQMTRIVEKLSAAVPDIIVDFDITESGRAVGLSFLSAGKYFLINNGPYLFNYDLPIDRQRQNWNLFFYPGPARTWICRSPLTYDKWIPSILFLTHYLPDDPAASQRINVASLILGQNGIWGDLPKISTEGVERIGDILDRYKEVKMDITASRAIVTGAVSSSPEIHEKVSTETGKGVVSLFATTPGHYTYVTAQKPAQTYWATPKTNVHYDAQGRAVIETEFSSPDAALVFFGAGKSV